MADITRRKSRRAACGVAELPPNLPLMLDTDTCGQIAGVTSKCIRDQLASGKLKGAKVGSAWRVNRDAFLEQMGLAEAYHG